MLDVQLADRLRLLDSLMSEVEKTNFVNAESIISELEEMHDFVLIEYENSSSDALTGDSPISRILPDPISEELL